MGQEWSETRSGVWRALSIRSETFMCKLLDYTIIPPGVKGSALQASKAYDALVAAVAASLKKAATQRCVDCGLSAAADKKLLLSFKA